MTYDPYRNATTPPDPYHRDPEDGSGGTMMLGALVLLAIGGFVYFFGTSDNTNVASNDLRPPVTQSSPSTTGAAPSAPPDATTGSASSPQTQPAPAR